MSEDLHRSFRLLPSEHLLWHGTPRPHVPRTLPWLVASGLCFVFALVAALFASLLSIAGIPAVRSTAFLGFYLLVTGIALYVMPAFFMSGVRYAVTERHVIWQRGQLRRVIERSAITYGRIHWHRSVPGVGSLELVRSVPFGPFARRQSMTLHDVEAPDRLLALVRGSTAGQFAGYCDVPLTDRLDAGERVVWGAAPAGLRLGRAELLFAALGGIVLAVAGVYCHRMASVVMKLERHGLSMHSTAWLLLVFVTLISASVILAIGCTLVWHGIWGARSLGEHSEYILTDSRVLIRRGRTELSVERRTIVDIVEQPNTGELFDLYLILDGPRAKALDDSGVLGWLSPPRSRVAPVLYEVRDRDLFRQLLLADRSAALRDVA
jgi:hypothetical protein